MWILVVDDVFFAMVLFDADLDVRHVDLVVT